MPVQKMVKEKLSSFRTCLKSVGGIVYRCWRSP